jgi:hypothetical protein
MELTDDEVEFLTRHHSAAMITLRPDGTPHAVRVGVALVDGRLCSSGTQGRLRTGHLRRDPRAALFVFEPRWGALTLESRVTILDGPEAPEQSLRLFQVMQGRDPNLETITWYGKELSREQFLEQMVSERRLIYEFEVLRTYGL